MRWGAPAGMVSTSCSLAFSGFVKKFLKTTRNKKKKKYRELKESIRMMNCQRSDAEKVSLIEEGKQ